MTIALAADVSLLALAVMALAVGALHYTGGASAVAAPVSITAPVSTSLENLLGITGIYEQLGEHITPFPRMWRAETAQ